jgi:hypothetical protein
MALKSCSQYKVNDTEKCFIFGGVDEQNIFHSGRIFRQCNAARRWRDIRTRFERVDINNMGFIHGSPANNAKYVLLLLIANLFNSGLKKYVLAE